MDQKPNQIKKINTYYIDEKDNSAVTAVVESEFGQRMKKKILSSMLVKGIINQTTFNHVKKNLEEGGKK